MSTIENLQICPAISAELAATKLKLEEAEKQIASLIEEIKRFDSSYDSTKPFSELEFELNDLSKEELIHLINFAHDKNITINEAIIQLLSVFVKNKEK